jgi:hydroxyacylglutathione hydrolase
MVERIVTGLLNTNTYIYSQWKKNCLIIDPGGNFDEIIGQLQKKNFTPLAIVLTHGHFDHLAEVGKLCKHFAAKDVHVPVYIHEKDAAFIGKNAAEAHMKNFDALGIAYNSVLHGFLGSLPEAEGYLREGDTILETDITVLHTPGHTPGSVSLYSARDLILFSGDTLFFEGVGRTDLPRGNHRDIISSICSKLFSLPDETRVFPGHGPFSTIEREKNHNPFVQDC